MISINEGSTNNTQAFQTTSQLGIAQSSKWWSPSAIERQLSLLEDFQWERWRRSASASYHPSTSGTACQPLRYPKDLRSSRSFPQPAAEPPKHSPNNYFTILISMLMLVHHAEFPIHWHWKGLAWLGLHLWVLCLSSSSSDHRIGGAPDRSVVPTANCTANNNILLIWQFNCLLLYMCTF